MKRIISLILVLLPVFAYAEKIVLGPATYTEDKSTETVLKNIMFHFEENTYNYATDKNGAFLGFFWCDDGGDVNNAKIFNSRIATQGRERFIKLEDSSIGIVPVYSYVMLTEFGFTTFYLIGTAGIRIEEFGADDTGHINENDRKWFIFIDWDNCGDQFIKLRDLLNKAAKIIN